jgi:putative tRNA adenosine deaminase-associated protein
VTYVATALARAGTGWIGDELDLDDVDDLDGVVELLRAVVGDDSDPALLFVEEDDEWFGVLRVDTDGDPRVFISDARVIATSEIAGMLGEAAVDSEPPDEPVIDDDSTAEEDDDEGTSTDADPAGDPNLLADLGTPGPQLLAMWAKEGQLPSDMITALCDAAGCLDVLDRLRGG